MSKRNILWDRQTPFPFQQKSIVKILALGAALVAATPIWAAEESDLQAEIARLRAQNAELTKALDTALGQPSSPASEAASQPSAELADSPVPATTTVTAAAGHKDSPQEILIRTTREYTPAILKDVPLSVSVVTGAELEKFNTADFRNILTRIGNVRATYTNPQAGSLIIRGVGWATGAGPLDPSVGVKVDGVSYGLSGLASSLNYIDIDTVDVTRGPQGTLGGKNTSLGEITIKSHIPSFVPEATASITYGQLNTISTSATVGGPVIDNLLAWRGTFLREQANGPFENQNDKNYSYKNTDRTFGRVQFLLTPAADFTALLNLEYAPVSKEVSDNYVNFVTPTPDYYDSLDANGARIAVDQSNESGGKLSRRWFAQEPNYSTEDYFSPEINRLSQNPNNYGSKGAALTLIWSPADYTITSITAYRDFYFDSGGGPISVFDIDRSPSTGHVEYEQLSQELRISSPVGGFIDYQAGLYYFQSEMPERWTTARFGSDAGAYYATTAQYNRLDATGNGRGLLQNSLDRLFTKTRDDLDNSSTAIYGNINWHFTEDFLLNTGLRLTHEVRDTNSSRFIVDEGFGAALDPVSINNVSLGGFNSNTTTGVLGTNTAQQLAVANSVAQTYFGVADYNILTAAQKQQVADAKAIRLARLGGLYLPTDAETFDEWLPTAIISPSYHINAQQTAYISWQHGEKAGISQVVGATTNGGKSALAKEEKSDTYELGLKSVLLDNTLVVNADIFLHRVKNYLQPLYYYDEAQTVFNNNGLLAYTAGLGNVPEIESKGLELDIVYSGIPYTDLRFAGAYTDATYKDFQFLAKPLELGGTKVPYYDVSGETLPGSAKVTFNLSADYSRPVFDNKQFHSNINYRYTSSYNNDLSLSRYAVVDAFGVADFAIGIGHRDGSFDVNFVVKNLFDTDYGFMGNWNNYFPSTPRWVGVTLNTRL